MTTAHQGGKLPLHIHIATLFTLLIVITGGVLAWNGYTQSRTMLLSASRDLFERVGEETAAGFRHLYQPVELLVDLLAHQRLQYDETLEERLRSLPYLKEGLDHTPAVSALYIGYASGDFFLLRPLASDGARFEPPQDAAWLVQSVDHDGANAPRSTFVFLDAGLREIARRDAPAFDPRERPWYRNGIATVAQVKTEPYVFFTTRDVGTTFARRTDTARSVVGADIRLRTLSDALGRNPVTPGSEAVLFNDAGQVLAYSRPERLDAAIAGTAEAVHPRVETLGVPVLAALMQRFRADSADGEFTLAADGRDWATYLVRLPVEGARQGVYLAVAAPQDELLAGARAARRDAVVTMLVIVLLAIPVAWVLSRLLSRPLRTLAREARSIQEFDFTAPIAARSVIAEIDGLAVTMGAMKGTIQRFLDIASTVSGERHFGPLLERVLTETMSSTGAQAGALYLLDDEGRVVQADATRDPDASATDLAQRSAAARRTLIEPTAAGTGLAVPLRNRAEELVGVLGLTMAGPPKAVPRSRVAFIEALSGTAAVAIENQRLLQAQKDLLESFIRLVAQAIDAKSPYTGGHCQRVPELTKMLAQAACDAEAGPFRDFALSEEEREALHIACWLHDCGKVTTPEYVVDKATKLETLYDRLHEIRMRFEVLKRDAEISFWRQIVEGGDRDALRAALEAQWRELDDDFAFIASCNEGGEFMAPERIERVKRIAQQTWLRTLDDRIGLSQDERARQARVPVAPLPVREPLLADKPAHVIERTTPDPAAAGNPWGFNIDVPPLKYNRGEIYNLCIGRGTLTAEERHTINDHIVQTIIMLRQLPFPRHLRHVPEIAGGHHEKMDGTGYPKRLAQNELSLPARMMAIADIFEALTAADRPYKKGKTLSEAVKIMGFMRKDRHIDPALFDLFLTAGIHQRYAERFMAPAQIDEVDIAAFVGR